MEDQLMHAHAPQRTEHEEAPGGLTMPPPEFSLNNGNETPPDEGGLRPELLQQLETPVPGEDEELEDEGMEMEESGPETDEKEDNAIQMKSAAPIQMASRLKKKKKNNLYKVVTKNGFTISLKNPTAKQRTYITRIRKIRVNDLGELQDILMYIRINRSGSLKPRLVRSKLRNGFMLNQSSGRFVNGNKDIVDFAKYNTSGFSLGNRNSTSGTKGQHELNIPHSSLDQNVAHTVNYKNTKGQDVQIKPNSQTGKLEKFWSNRAFGKNTSKAMDQQKSGDFLSYLATKRKKLLDEKSNYGLQDQRYWELHTAIINMSEMIAELSTQMAVDKFLPGATTHDSHTKGGKQGEFDQVHSKNGEYYAMECKGGGSSLGGRKNPNGPGKVQQGSSGYTDDLLNNYINDPTSNIRNLGNQMQTARGQGKLNYLHAKQTFQNDGSITPYLHMKKFDI